MMSRVLLLLMFSCAGKFPAEAQSIFKHWQTANQQIKAGNEAYANGHWDEAMSSYREAFRKDNNLPEAAFNLGNAHFSAAQYDSAGNWYKQVLPMLPGDALKSAAYHNLGNSLLKAGKLEESIEAYKHALRLQPADDDTRYNLAYAQALLQQQENEQQNEEDEQQQEDDEQQQNDEKQNENGDDDDEQNKQDNGEQEENQQQNKNEPQPVKITEEQAEQMLAALRMQELKLQEKMQEEKMKALKRKTDKDW